MKKISLIILSLLLLINVPAAAALLDETVTVTFKTGTSDKYIKLVCLMTETRLKKKLAKNTYELEIPSNKRQSLLGDYTKLFWLMPEVVNVKSDYDVDINNLKSGQVIPGILLVKFKEGASKEAINNLNQKYAIRAEIYIPTLNLYKVRVPKEVSLEEVLDYYGKSELVEYAEPDRVMNIQNNGIKATIDSNDAQFIRVFFKSGGEELAIMVFNLIFDTTFVEKKGFNSFILKLSEDVNPDLAVKVFKLCPYILDIELVKRK